MCLYNRISRLQSSGFSQGDLVSVPQPSRRKADLLDLHLSKGTQMGRTSLKDVRIRVPVKEGGSRVEKEKTGRP